MADLTLRKPCANIINLTKLNINRDKYVNDERIVDPTKDSILTEGNVV